MLAVLLLLIIGGGAAAPGQPWLSHAGPASAAYFSAGTASAGVISCSSGLGMGFFSIGLVSFGVVGSVGVFSVGFFSIGFFSIGIFSLGHIACGVWAWGAYSRWMQRGQVPPSRSRTPPPLVLRRVPLSMSFSHALYALLSCTVLGALGLDRRRQDGSRLQSAASDAKDARRGDAGPVARLT